MKAWVLIAGGGTGGHLFPGLAVAGALGRAAPELRVAFVSAGRALESGLLQEAGYPLEALKVRGLRGAGLSERLASLAALPGAVLGALGLLRRYQPRLVLAVGGYAAFPLGLAAWLQGLPLAVQEQNALPGVTNRCLGRLARMVFTAFPGAEKHFSAGKARLVGNPVRAQVLEGAARAAVRRPPAQEHFNLLVLGGSQGAQSINRTLTSALPLMDDLKHRLNITHQTGGDHQAQVQEAYRGAGWQAKVQGFIPEMGQAYGSAHLVICRAGAGTLTELAACGRAGAAVPYPFAAGDHQTCNAQALVKAGAGLLIPDSQFNPERAAGLIRDLMAAPARLAEMERRSLSLARPDAARDIAAHCLELIREAG